MNDWNSDKTTSTLSTSDTLKNFQSNRGRAGSLGAAAIDSFMGAHTGGILGDISPFSTDYSRGSSLGAAGLFSSASSLGNYSLVGIKASEVEPMREAIRNYVTDIQDILKTALESNATEFNKAIRGAEVEKAVNGYVDKVKTYCNNVVSGLLVLSDKIADVGNAWLTYTQNAQSTVSGDTSSFSEGSVYQDNLKYNGGVGSGLASAATSGAAAAVGRPTM